MLYMACLMIPIAHWWSLILLTLVFENYPESIKLVVAVVVLYNIRSGGPTALPNN